MKRGVLQDLRPVFLCVLIVMCLRSEVIFAQVTGQEAPAYIQLRRDVLINADRWTDQPEILAANFGFEGIIGIPGLRSADDLQLAIAAGAGVNGDFAQLNPVPSLRNLTSGAGSAGVLLAGFGDTPILGDALPIEVSWPLLPGSVQPENIAVTLNTGEVVTPVAAALNPNYDYNERHVIVIFGEFGNRLVPGTSGAVHPVEVSFVDGSAALMAVGPNGPVSLTGLTSPSSSPYLAGPGLVGARLTRFSPVGDFSPPALSGAFPNDALSLYGDDAEFRLRLFTTGGFSPDGVSGFLATDFEKFFRLHAVDANGQPVVIAQSGQVYDLGVGEIQVVGLAEVGPPTDSGIEPELAYGVEDHDNYFDIILKGDEAAIRLLEFVEIPTSAVSGYSDIYNPGGPGRTPFRGVIYTEPALPATFAITDAIDNPGTITYASQNFASYDLDDDLPVVFRVSSPSGPDQFTTSSNEAASMLAAGSTVKAVEFANETARTGVSDVNAFFNPSTNDRIYTLDTDESLQLASSSDWQNTGRAFGAFDRIWPGAVPVYRFFDTETGWHDFASDLNNVFQTDGIEYQGIGWYAASFVSPQNELQFDRTDDLHLTDALVSDRLLVIDGPGTLRLSGGALSQGIAVRNGRLDVDGPLSGGLLTVDAEGVLSGRGPISNEVTVAGRLAPGSSPGTMTFLSSVNMAATGILEIEVDGTSPVDGANGYDRIVVAGEDSQFLAAGTLDVRLRDITTPATNSFTPTLGQRFSGVITTAGGIAGSFDTLSQPDSGLLSGTRFDTIYNALSLDLVVTPEQYGNLAAAGLSPNINQRSIGAALDAIRPAAGVRPTGAAAILFPSLAPLSSDEILTALDMLSGQVHGDALDVSLGGQRLLQSALHSRLASFVGNDTVHATWMQILGRRANQQVSHSLSGYDADHYGVVAGIDRRLTPDMHFGIALGSLTSDVASDFGRTDIESLFISIHGAKLFDDSQISGHFLSTLDMYETIRAVSIGMLNSGPSSDSDGWGLNTGATFRHSLLTGDIVTVDSIISFTLGRVERDAFTESNAGSEALSVHESSRTSARSRIGSIMTCARGNLSGTFSVGWNHELLDESAQVTSTLAGSSFAVRAASPGRDFFDLDVGLGGELGAGLWLSGNYLMAAAESFTSHGGVVQLQLLW